MLSLLFVAVAVLGMGFVGRGASDIAMSSMVMLGNVR